MIFVVFVFTANAKEMSGFFGGAELGLGYADLKTKITSYSSVNQVRGGQTTINNNTKTQPHQSDYWYGNANYGILAGYKQFFNKYFGLRYYADLNFLHVDFPITKIGTPHTSKSNINTTITREVTTTQTPATIINYTANVDVLVNFVNLEKVIFGVFAGVGIGGFTWVEQSKNYTNLFFATNVGLRTSILQNHSIELVARIPFVSQVQDKSRTNIAYFRQEIPVGYYGATEAITTTTITDMEILDSRKQSWNLALRYIYSF